MIEGLELLKTLEGATISKVAATRGEDDFYLRMSDDRIIWIWGMETNVSTGIPLVREVVLKDLSPTLRAALGFEMTNPDRR